METQEALDILAAADPDDPVVRALVTLVLARENREADDLAIMAAGSKVAPRGTTTPS